jgi:cobalt/nickel transport system permease protein
LFIRAYERGERIHHAMLARGFDGSMPVLDPPGLARPRWELAAGFAGALWVVAIMAMVLA